MPKQSYDEARFHLFCSLWAQHAPIPWSWPHDETFEKWFSQAIPAIFKALEERVALHSLTTDILDLLKELEDAAVTGPDSDPACPCCREMMPMCFDVKIHRENCKLAEMMRRLQERIVSLT